MAEYVASLLVQAASPKWRQTTPNGEAASPNDTSTNTRERTKENTVKKKGVVLPFDSKEFSVAWQSWKDYKRDEHGFKFKSSASEQASLHQLQNLSGGDEPTAVRIIGQSLANGWRGFFPLKNQHNESRANRGPSDGSNPTAHLRKLADESGEKLGLRAQRPRVLPRQPCPHRGDASHPSQGHPQLPRVLKDHYSGPRPHRCRPPFARRLPSHEARGVAHHLPPTQDRRVPRPL